MSIARPIEAPALQSPAISARRLTKIFRSEAGRETHALKDVSFDIAEGEFICLVGRSGCGKSTLLKIMAGLLPRTSGALSIAGRDVRGPSAEMAMVFQSPVLMPWRTILQNVLLPIEFRREPMAPARARARDLLAMVGLSDFESCYPHELSGGMQQRAAIVRALISDPGILLMDEPFGALDAMTREQMSLDLLTIWEASRKTIVFVTHSITESIFLADRVFVLTPRPGVLSEIVEIDLPRPRTLGMINTEAFGVYANRIRVLLQAEGDMS